MALSLVQVYPRSGWRIRAIFSGGDPSGAQTTDFAIARQDAGPTTAVVASLFSIDATALELATSERLVTGVIYTLTWSGTTFAFTYTPQIELQPNIQSPTDDPDAEANGVDLAWISGNPTATGDCPNRRGIDCVQYDLANRAGLLPGELVQDQSAGAGLVLKVSGAATDAEMKRIAGGLENELKRDARVQDVAIDTTTSSDGKVGFNGQVQTASGLQAPVRST